ncbi:MAG TPA: sigma-70 family RNA polymerase sigma factor [Puia sp.]|nr:sigma-70 family RNA polymerase sigma factor [Puia sp.]
MALRKKHGSGDIMKLFKPLREKERSAIKLLYDSYFPLVYNAIYQIVKDEATTEELVHDSFLKFLNSMDTIEHPEKAEGYLYTVARNTAIDHYRREDKLKTREREFLDRQLNECPEEVYNTEAEMWEMLWLQAKKLHPEKREVFELRFKYKKEIKDIAQELGITEKNVRKRLDRAIRDLKKVMPEDFFLFWMLVCVLGPDFLK